MEKLLKKYQQNNLLMYFEKLNEEEKKILINDLKKVDFKLMNKLYVNSYIDEVLDLNKVSALKCVSNDVKGEYINKGE